MKNKTTKTTILDHYRQADLEKNIQTAFKTAGRRINDYTDTESLDEFHIRGREATRELARLANLKPDMRVLDLGCGVGGPARMLAAEFGCRVTGVDLVDEYCRAAEMITRHAGLSHLVNFQTGDMTALPFDDRSFDAAWTLHTIMNIKDKPKLFNRIFHILKPGGLFILYEVCKGANSPPRFPVPWASDASMSFLLPPDDLCREILQHGFAQLHWQDVSDAAIGWFQAIAASRAALEKKKQAANTEKIIQPHSKRSKPGISLLLGKNAVEKSQNVFQNLCDDRIRTFFGVFQKS